MNNSNKKIIILVLTILVLVSGVSIAYVINNKELDKKDSGELSIYFKDNTNSYSYNLEEDKVVEFTINSKNVIDNVSYQIKLDINSDNEDIVVNLEDNKEKVLLSEDLLELEQDKDGYYILTNSLVDDINKIEKLKLNLTGTGNVSYRILLDTVYNDK